jgi:hypothetical protein
MAKYAWAVAPYSPPCELEEHHLERARTDFEHCKENFLSKVENTPKEQIKSKCSNEFEYYLNAISVIKKCQDNITVFHTKK